MPAFRGFGEDSESSAFRGVRGEEDAGFAVGGGGDDLVELGVPEGGGNGAAGGDESDEFGAEGGGIEDVKVAGGRADEDVGPGRGEADAAGWEVCRG